MLDIKEVAEAMDVCEKIIYRLAQAKKIPFLKVGKVYKFCPRTLQHRVRKQHPDFAKATKKDASKPTRSDSNRGFDLSLIPSVRSAATVVCNYQAAIFATGFSAE